MPTKQETFDIVAEHLLRQGRKSLTAKSDPDGTRAYVCRYRGDGGTSCAVGVLIPDGDYFDDLEGNTVVGSPTIRHLIGRLGHDVRLVAELQEVHDIFTPEEWGQELREIAERHELSPAVVERVQAELSGA